MSLEKIKELQALIMDLDTEVSNFIKSTPSLEDACESLAEFNFLKRDLSSVYDVFAKSVADLMDTVEEVALPDGATIEKKSSYDRKGWKHADLGIEVARKLAQMAVNMDTGEVERSPEEIAADMLSYCSPAYWKIKPLNAIGINPDNFCEVGELKTSIIVRKSKKNQ
jgi:hypothetical protein